MAPQNSAACVSGGRVTKSNPDLLLRDTRQLGGQEATNRQSAALRFLERISWRKTRW
jgi:hypothetical protein